ncbi:MFS transporter [Microbacterium sp. Yaish 1]|uniref:MFS transporter n=1 Tax=Microbacterium sp. Yaish 1 TaxID=2025014 RepID=UPI000B9420AE|nr:MFS transporter [Microbacterium sp. Yaish 1]OYC98400.1 hypothetical protein CI089_08010 [Microbacterium sp. Yaish 1]
MSRQRITAPLGASQIVQAPTRKTAATVLAASTLTIMAAAVISPSLPAMRVAYEAVPGADLLVKIVITITSAAIALTAPLAGTLASRIGTRPVLFGGLMLYALSGSAGLIVTDPLPLLVSRIVLGVGVGAIMTAVSTTIASLWRGEERARLLGGQQLFASLGGVVFLSLAGWLSTVDWRAPFGIYAVALLLIPLVLATRLAPPLDGQVQVDELDAGLRPGVTSIVSIYALAFGSTAVFFLAPTQLPFILDDLGVGTTATGFVVAASMATGVIGSLWFPALRRRMAPATVAAVGLGLLGIGWVVIGVGAPASWVGPLLGAFVGGIGVGVTVPNLNFWISELAGSARRGVLLGGLVSAIFAGQFVSPILAQPLVDLAGIGATFAYGGAVVAAVALALAVPEILSSSRASSDAGRPRKKGQNK